MSVRIEHIRDALRARHPSARARKDGDLLAIEIEVDATTHRVRIDSGAADREPRITTPIPTTDGFVLGVRWADRWAGSSGRDRDPLLVAPSFDDAAIIETNDPALAAAWIDHHVRDALLVSRLSPDHLDQMTAWRETGWAFELDGDEVTAWRLPGESALERLVVILDVVLALAARPVRWIKAFGAAATRLGGELAARVEVGGKPVLRVRRGPVDVRISLVRRLGPGDPGRLRTELVARRLDVTSSELPATPRAAELLAVCNPITPTLRGPDLSLVFEGVVTDAERLDAAVELAAHWCTETSAGTFGPYR